MPNENTREPWNTDRGGLPQIFRIGDFVQVRQDGAAPSEWCCDWARIRLRIVGTIIDESVSGRVAYFIHAEGDSRREHDPMSEDWLEAATDV